MIAVFGVIDSAAGTTVDGIGTVNAGLIFLAGLVLASSIEFIAGWGLYHLFHARWWDYRKKPFNLGGYICLEFSIYWGIGALLVVRILHPVVNRFTAGLLPQRWGWPLLALMYAVWLADSVVTVLIVLGFNKHLAELDDLRTSMRMVSDDLSERIGTQTLESMQRIDESRVQAALARAELRDAVEEARENRAALNARRRREAEERARQLRAAIRKRHVFGARRLMKAFPGLSYENEVYNAIMREIRTEIYGEGRGEKTKGENPSA
jgi:uncharacterized membrane protein